MNNFFKKLLNIFSEKKMDKCKIVFLTLFERFMAGFLLFLWLVILEDYGTLNIEENPEVIAKIDIDAEKRLYNVLFDVLFVFSLCGVINRMYVHLQTGHYKNLFEYFNLGPTRTTPYILPK